MNTESMKEIMNKYVFVLKTQVIKSFTYNFKVYINILIQIIIMVTAAFFWRALYSGHSMVGGVDVDSMLTYIIMSSVLSTVLWTNVERRIQESVENGSIATDLMKPVNIFGVYLAEDIGSVVALVFENMLPVLIIGSLLIKVPKICDVRMIPLFALSLLGSFAINWLVAALFGMFSFLAINIDALVQVKKHLVRLLSGSIIPLWFFPEGLRNVLEALPFVYIYQLPLDIYVGRSSIDEIYHMLAIQGIWVVILLFLFVLIENRATRKVMVQGG